MMNEETMASRRQQLKRDARGFLDKNFTFYLLLFLPIYILGLAVGFGNFAFNLNGNLAGGDWLSLLSIVSSLLSIGVSFVMIDLQRGVGEFTEPVSKSFTIFNRGSYFLGSLALIILVGIFTFLWSLLLIVPGIIKTLSYSQAIFIYRDYLDQGKKIGFLEAITLSRKMMDGHKWEYFVIGLSFIGWGLACIIIIPIIWVYPYMNQTLANFYVKLAAEDVQGTDEEDEKPTLVTSDKNSEAAPTETFYPDSKSKSDDSSHNDQ
ncbi:hypothetical protein IWT5_01640 [Secundilactobacillus silagincola]|jgi:uncharacterized membrane protein|uniref:Integral membrane protein n=2 Tax=Secundilactobacillus silagincola TaxID=1714681 RepID=A0A1Z5J368_9LACO|nr:hypothetical protein IWT5_01640 [Secundilactobacillus silagincola]